MSRDLYSKVTLDSISENSVEKMIQHDPTEQLHAQLPMSINDIDKIPKDTDDFQKIDVKFTLPYFVFKELNNNIKKKFGDNGPTPNGFLEGKIKEWNKEQELDHHVGSLSFGGSFPRIDVLYRLHDISIELESWPEYPNFKRNHLEAILRKIIGYKDPRTFRKYLDCIVTFVETKNNGRIVFFGDYDVGGFRKAVEEALSRTEKRSEN